MRASENLAGTVLFQVRIYLAQARLDPSTLSPGYHTARFEHCSPHLLPALSSPCPQGACTLRRNSVKAAAGCLVLPAPVPVRLGVVLSHPAGRFCRPAFHSEHSSIPVHTSLLAGNCLPKIQPVIQSSQTLCLWWLKPQTLAQ